MSQEFKDLFERENNLVLEAIMDVNKSSRNEGY